MTDQSAVDRSPSEEGFMADHTKRGPPNDTVADPDQEYEIRYWATKFGCSPQQLKAALEKYGSDVDKVRRIMVKRLSSDSAIDPPCEPNRR